MTSVFISEAAYNDSLEPIVRNMLDQTIGDRVFPGARILIKPNLLMPVRPSRGILTHPLVVRAVARWALDRRGKVQVSDSPGIGPFNKILQEGEYLETCRDLPIDWQPFSRPTAVDIGPPFGRIELAADALEADLVINLAKLKTHVMMRMTLGVKNLFGCVIGLEKTRWHYRAGIDRNFFARLLVQICKAIDPDVTIIDGILGLEGQGPGIGGTPRHIGILAAGTDPFGLDFTIARSVGCPPESLPTHVAALGLGYFSGMPDIVGCDSPAHKLLLPELGSSGFGPPSLQKLMRKYLLRRPRVARPDCRVCGLCVKQCPADAIAILSDGLRFDYDRCIRCYCCVEVCPHGALSAMEPLGGKMLRQLKTWSLPVLQRLGLDQEKTPGPH
jgi:uncharacterized protein (DUF362 family)/NAD-dependent dihydropyrimidine dehydrogenase PreA subunit